MLRQDFYAGRAALAGKQLLFVVEWRDTMYTAFGPVGSLPALLSGRPEIGELTDARVHASSEGLHSVRSVHASGSGNTPAVARFDLLLEPVVVETPTEANSVLPHPLVVKGRPERSVPNGFIAVLGGSGSGKSLFARASGAHYISIGEPVAGSLPFSPVAYAGAVQAALAAPAGSVVVIDSLRLAMLTGRSLGPGGVPRDLGSLLSHLDFAARHAGVTILGVMNVLTSDQRAIESATELISGSCSGVITTTGHELGNDGLMRVRGDISVRPTEREPRAFVFTINNMRGVK